MAIEPSSEKIGEESGWPFTPNRTAWGKEIRNDHHSFPDAHRVLFAQGKPYAGRNSCARSGFRHRPNRAEAVGAVVSCCEHDSSGATAIERSELIKYQTRMSTMDRVADALGAQGPWLAVSEAHSPASFHSVLAHVINCGPFYCAGLRRVESVRTYRCRISTDPVYRFTLIGGKTHFDLVAKWCYGDESNDEGAAERDYYQAFNSRFADARTSCPKVLDYISHANVLITQYDAAPTMLRVIHPLRRNLGALITAAELCGLWLSSFHAIRLSRLDDARCVAAHLRAFCPEYWDGEAALLAVVEAVLGAACAESVMAARIFLTDRCPGTVCEIGAIHGDFGVSNVLVGDNRVVVLDAARQHDGPQLIDLASFWVGIMISGRLRGMCRTSLELLTDAFWRSYFSRTKRLDIDKRLYGAFLILCLVRSLARHSAYLSSPGSLRYAAVSRLLRALYARPFEYATGLYRNGDYGNAKSLLHEASRAMSTTSAM